MTSPQVAAINRLGKLAREYEDKATAIAELAEDAAVAEAEHKRLRAVKISTLTIQDKMPVSKAEAVADADDAVSTAYLNRLTTAAAYEAARAKLRQLDTHIGYGRTVIASERAADSIHSTGVSGAA